MQNGMYSMTEKGYEKISSLKLEVQPRFLRSNIVFTFYTPDMVSIDGHMYKLSATIYPVKGYVLKLNDEEISLSRISEKIDKAFGQQIDHEKKASVLKWVLERDNYSWKIENTNPYKEIVANTISKDKNDNFLNENHLQGGEINDNSENILKGTNSLSSFFLEGKDREYLLHGKERSDELVARKKEEAYSKNPKLPCEICGFSFVEKYGIDFIEAHHISHISKLAGEVSHTVDDLTLVCANCHRMLHSKKLGLTIEELKQKLQGNKSID
jgi:hypothetical protein